MPPALAIVLAIISPIITIITLLVGVSVLWGKFSTIVEMVKSEVDRLREAVNEIKEDHTSFHEEVMVKFAENAGASQRGSRRVLVKKHKRKAN